MRGGGGTLTDGALIGSEVRTGAADSVSAPCLTRGEITSGPSFERLGRNLVRESTLGRGIAVTERGVGSCLEDGRSSADGGALTRTMESPTLGIPERISPIRNGRF